MNMKTILKIFSSISLRSFFLVYFLVFSYCFLFAQCFEDVYPKQFSDALALKKLYEELLINKNVKNPNFYLSLVFPEMERYSESRDNLEVFLTKITYTTIDNYEGCSIGPFQMKPSFAKRVEKEVQELGLSTEYASLVFLDNDSFSDRYNRIIRLQSQDYQITYLLAFVSICEKKYGIGNLSDKDRLRIISSAYNAGLEKTFLELQEYSKIKSFPDGINSSKSLWNYSDLVVHYYELFTGSH